jgi:site-specific DNA-cytosine methylase
VKPVLTPTLTRKGSRQGSGLFDELIVDNFAGAGGASMGIEAAVGRSVDIAINHDAHSVRAHQVNHPHTRHLCEDVWQVDPDIGLRMLTPRELLNAQFGKYAKGYVLIGTKAQQVAGIGNSVPPELAEAMVRANFCTELEVAA